MKHTIEIAGDTTECQQFADWLNAQGHTATIGRSTGSYVDGVWTCSDVDASEIFNTLWLSYCDSF